MSGKFAAGDAGTNAAGASGVSSGRGLVSYRGCNNTSSKTSSDTSVSIQHRSTPEKAMGTEVDGLTAEQLLPLAGAIDVGVDRVRLHYELDSNYTDGPSMEPFRARRGGNVTVEVDGVDLGVHITIRCQGGRLGGVRMWASVEFNPAHVAQEQAGEPRALCPWEATQAICRRVVALVADVAPALPGPIALAGLHLTRDFVVDDASRWVAAVIGTRPAWSREQAVYVGDTGEAETVVSGSKSRRVVVYVKSPKILRWESQVTTAKALGRLELLSVDDLVPEALAQATVDLWRHSRLWAVRMRPRLIDLVTAERAKDDVREFYGWLASSAEGLPLDHGLTSRRRQALKARAASLGIEVTARAVRVKQPGYRLELVSGTEVAALDVG